MEQCYTHFLAFCPRGHESNLYDKSLYAHIFNAYHLTGKF